MDIGNLKTFFHHGLEWVSYLNKDINQSSSSEIKHDYLNRIIVISFIEYNYYINYKYSFPDEDLCLFKEFPHRQLVIPLFPFLEKETECSCTLIWLFKNLNLVGVELVICLYDTYVSA